MVKQQYLYSHISQSFGLCVYLLLGEFNAFMLFLAYFYNLTLRSFRLYYYNVFRIRIQTNIRCSPKIIPSTLLQCSNVIMFIIWC